MRDSEIKIVLLTNAANLKNIERMLLWVCLYVHAYIYIYTGDPRRNVPDFGRVFLMLKYTDITQNTYVQS